MWDYIEHPFDPISDLLQIHKHMSENGLLFIKTPNLDCPELEIFGADYHSLKLEHLHYFSKTSLVAALRKCGFVVDSVTTKSHLLKGFFGGIITTQSEKSHRGSDITVIARKV
jgi:hypothetical protein